MTDTIGWIGLGAMGGAMAKRVADAGFPIVVHDLRAEAMASLMASGTEMAKLSGGSPTPLDE